MIRQSQVRFELKDPSHNATNVTLFTQIEFKTPGTYYMEVLVDDVMKLRFPIPVILAQQQGGAQRPPAQAPQGPAAPTA